MTKHPLLTAEKELELARQLERIDLSIVRLLLSSEEGRAALLETARALREGEVDPQDVERNPAARDATGEPLAGRIERLVASSGARAKSRPRAFGLRLHPRAISAIEAGLEETLARRPSARIRAFLRELEELRLRGE